MMFVADTHSLIWYFEDSRKLGDHAGKILANTDNSIICPTIVLAEILFLFRKGKTSNSFDTLSRAISFDPRFIVYPMDEEIVQNIPEGIEMHDGIIIATSLIWKQKTGYEAPIITKDRAIGRMAKIKTIW